MNSLMRYIFKFKSDSFLYGLTKIHQEISLEKNFSNYPLHPSRHRRGGSHVQGAEPVDEGFCFNQHDERGSVMARSNLSFDEWTGVCGSERLTSALLDRLTHDISRS